MGIFVNMRSQWPRFLLAQLYLGTLEDKVTPKEMKQALRKFQRISLGNAKDQKREVLKAIYDDTMKRIKEQKPGFCHLATNALSWLSHAKRQLKTVELQHALAVNMEVDSGRGRIPEKFHADSIPDIDLIVSSCHGLVTVDEESQVIRLVHYTTQEYFDRMRRQWFPEAETKIANVCTLYITVDEFYSYEKERENYPRIEKKLQLDPFFGYACANWGYHARGADSSSHFIHVFLADKWSVRTAAQTVCYMQLFQANNWNVMDITLVTALELAAFFGAVDLMYRLPSILNTSFRVDDLDSALYSALYNKQSDAIMLLLDMGADIGAKDRYGRKPLHRAALWGDVDGVRLLLDLGADPNAYDKWSQTAILQAAYRGHTAVVRLLLERGADFAKADTNRLTPVDYAVYDDNKAMIQDFLKTVTGSKPRVYLLKNTILRAAINCSDFEAFRLVFEEGPRPKLNGRFGSKLLFKAVTRNEASRRVYRVDRYELKGDLAIVELLLAKGAKLIQSGSYGKKRMLARTGISHEWLAQKIPALFTEERRWIRKSCRT